MIAFMDSQLLLFILVNIKYMIKNLGKYILMLYYIFFKPEKFSVYWKRFLDEVIQLGVKSLFIVSLMSAFMGAVLSNSNCNCY
jgi:ABC-type transporter Mla maintaining outer membrane lipid asymmetry permease subunit MlaE